MLEKLINVGIADIKISVDTNSVLRTILGSCVGICVYDRQNKIGGMAHIMLPAQKEDGSNFMKYADKAIPYLISEMEKKGADKKSMEAKIAGGASMFELDSNSFMAEIGKKNVEAVESLLKEQHIKIKGSDIGGNKGRTIDLYIGDGRLRIKKFNDPERFI